MSLLKSDAETQRREFLRLKTILERRHITFSLIHVSQISRPVYTVNILVGQRLKSESSAASVSEPRTVTLYYQSPEPTATTIDIDPSVEDFDYGLQGVVAAAVRIEHKPPRSARSTPSVYSLR